MKNLLCFLIVLIAGFQRYVAAQDTIFLVNESIILATATKYVNDTVFYLPFSTTEQVDSNLYQIKSEEVIKIKYANGLLYQVGGVSKTGALKKQDLYSQGFNDSQLYYKKYKGAAIGTAATTAVTGMFIGLAPAIACSFTEPRYENLDIPQGSPLAQDSNYVEGYMKGAAKIKRKKVLNGYGIGLGIRTAAILSIFILASVGL